MFQHTTATSRRGIRRGAAALAAGVLLAGLPASIVAAQSPPEDPGPALAPQVVDQMAAIAEEKATRTPAERKVDSNLLYAANEAAGRHAVDGAPQLQSTVEPDGGRVEVDIEATVGEGLLAAIVGSGGKVIASVPAFDAVRASVPVGKVVALAARGEVREIRPADQATTNRAAGGDATTASVGAGANEADVTHAAATARTTYGVDGTGVKVCVLSDGVTSLAARQASGDLPAVDVLPGQAGTGDEGTAMLELIHDIAPGAELGFATAFTSLASFAQNIIDLRADGCDAIVDDVTYFSETTLQDGPIAQAITTVRNAGAIYFTSAGNSGNLPDGTSGTWQGDFQDGGPSQSPLVLGLRLHGWGQGVGYNTITKTGGPINLQWADPVGASSNDYDLYLLNSTGTSITASSTNVQSGTQNPAESLASSPSGSRILVTKPVAAASRYLVLYTNRGGLTYGTGGAARGHNVSLDAVSVAATPAAGAFNASSPTGPFPGTHSGTDLSETFSSDGPTRQYFTPAGAAITPGNFSSTGGVGRNGIDITAADGATTTTPGFIPFYGTSAAAPNAAAIAALALEAKPTLTPLQLENALGATAIDIEAAGYDPVAGAGIVMVPALLTNVGATPKAKLVASTRSVTPQTGDGDAHLEPGETATITQLLRNDGAATATGITATLASNSPDATVTQGSVTYANIGVSATGSPNSLPFRISVSPGCPCGTTLSFTLTVSYSGGNQPTLVIPVEIVVGEPGPQQTTTYAGAPVAIPDNNPTGASATLSVASTAKLRNLTFTIGGSACSTTGGSTTVGLDHTYVGDLRLTLTSPSGTTITLMDEAGGSGNNLCNTTFSDAGATSIQALGSGSAPYTGTFRPLEPLSTFVGENPAGTWTLKAVDTANGDTGSIRNFSMQYQSTTCTIPNAAPVGVADSYSMVQGGVLTVSAPGVLGNDTDANSDALTAAVVNAPAKGSLSFNANGSFTYTPTPSAKGSDTFTYRASDGSLQSGLTTVSITINGTPVAGADSYTVVRNAALQVNAPGVLGNDTDPEGSSITATLVAGPSHGTLSLNANGSFLYTPTTGYAGPDSFTYKATDGATSSAAQTVSITVNAQPVAANDSFAATLNTTLNVPAPGVLGNDTDNEGETLTTQLGTGPSHGSLILNANGSFSYTPANGYTGPDSFTYRAKDARSQSNLATVSLDVSASNAAPSALNDNYSTPRNTPLTVSAPGVLGNDSDPNGDSITAVLVAGPASGTLGLDADGSFTYTPAAGFSGNATFTYKASDGSLQSSTATVTIKVNGAPTAVADSYGVPFQTPLNVAAPGVLGNDTDPEGDALTATLGVGPSHDAAFSLNANGSFSYTPDTGYSGPDSFTYRAVDATGQSSLVTVTLTVSDSSNAAPTAVGDSFRVVTGRTLLRGAPGLLANDADPESSPLSAAKVTNPSHGTATVNADGSFSYTPTAGYTGTDSFTYRVSDGVLQSAPATVTIVVISPTVAYVDAIYGDFLNRAGETGGVSYWASRLDRGVETRTTFVLKMSRSNEYSVKIVTRAFNDVLGRNPDPSGRTYWASKVQKGMPVATLVLNLIASNEYLTKSGGTNTGFVNATFQAILGRQPSSSERTARVNELNAGKKRLALATELYNSTESRRRRTRVQFLDLLDRQPTTAELNDWVAKLATKSDIDLAIALGAGQEYYNAAQLL